MNYSNIIGQNKISKYLRHVVREKNFSHAYIFAGEDGMGKTAMAEAFASSILCEEGGEVSCGKCRSCVQAASKNNPDIIYVEHEKPNLISVAEIREQLCDDIDIAPYAGGKKIYIVKDANLLGQEGQNALLKSIEEPPEYVVVLLLTSNAALFLPTVLSRCIKLNFAPVADEDIYEYVKRQTGSSDVVARSIASFAKGNPGRALKLADSEEFSESINQIIKLAEMIVDRELYELKQFADKVPEMFSSVDEFLDLLINLYKDVLLYKSLGDASKVTFAQNISLIAKYADRYSYASLSVICDEISMARRYIKSNVKAEYVLFTMLLKIKENS